MPTLFKMLIASVLLFLASSASGPKPPAKSVDHEQEIRAWVANFARICLDRNLTTHPLPTRPLFLPRKLRFNYGHLLAADGGSTVPHSCADWRATGGKQFMVGIHHINSEASAQWNDEFFAFQNHATLVNVVKEIFGVIYHEAQRSAQACGDSTHHTMLLRDGKTVLYLDFMYWSSRGTSCHDKNKYQAVMLRLAQPCAALGGTMPICGPQRDADSRFRTSGERVWHEEMVGEWSASRQWVNSPNILDDVIVRAVDVLNLDRLDAEQQLESAMRWDERVDQADYFIAVNGLSQWIADRKAHIRDMNAGERELISQQLQEKRRRSDNFANLFAESFGQAMSNLQQSGQEIQQREREIAYATQQTRQRQQQVEAVRTLAERQAFDSRQLPVANPMTQPLPKQANTSALPDSIVASREQRCRARPGYRWSPQTGACESDVATAPRPISVGAAAMPTGSASATAAAPNQCWFSPEPPNSSCVETVVERRNGDVILRNRNLCSRRIYVSACGERVGQNDFCAVSGILPGGQWSHRIYQSWQPTGQFNVRWVGSDRGVEDWVCAGEAGWNR